MQDFFYGVIEGFYGRQWSWQTRRDYAAFLARYRFDCYLFAPKGEAALRSQWRGGLPAALCGELEQLGDCYRRRGVRWGLGLSPLGLFERFGDDDRRRLRQVITQINALQPDVLCILFDDVRGDIPGLGQRQCEIVAEILATSTARQHLMCPTYYSFDPVLERVFGTMPAGYLEQLGAGLAPEVGIFWTGNRVISDTISVGDIGAVSERLGRKPVLWDNYPVNDGRATCGHLHLRPYQGRPAALREATAGHIVNPMNQPALSQLVLQSLAALYRDAPAYDAGAAWLAGLALLADDALARQLNGDAGRFQDVGLDGLSSDERAALATVYAGFGHPAAAEVADWLAGGYRFDPACLTG